LEDKDGSRPADLDYDNKFRYKGPEEDMGYKFRSRRHMLESMTHKSVAEKMINLIKE